MPEPASKSGAKVDEPDAGLAVAESGPPEEEFWDKYNKRLEFPLSTVSAILIHVLVGALLVFVLVRLMDREGDKSGMPVKLIEMGGLDDEGLGSAGSGSEEEAVWNRDANQTKDAITNLVDPAQLPNIKKELQEAVKYLAKSGDLPITDSNAAALAGLNEKIRDKLLGQKQGGGGGPGSGTSGQTGTGPGGTGADSTLGRSMRWVLRFRVTNGRDYLEQLRAMGAKIYVPLPNSDKGILVEDLGRPTEHRVVGPEGLNTLSGLQQFSDSRRDAVKGIAGAIGLDFMPKTFWAFFPKSVEEDLAAKEKNYRNRRPEDIAETVFKVTIRGGSYSIVVDDQKVK